MKSLRFILSITIVISFFFSFIFTCSAKNLQYWENTHKDIHITGTSDDWYQKTSVEFSADAAALEAWASQSSSSINDVATDWSTTEAGTLTDYIGKWINYIIWVLALIVLFLLIYNWIVMITAWWNEERYQEWFKNLRNYTIGIFFIWLVWLFIKLILYIITLF